MYQLASGQVTKPSAEVSPEFDWLRLWRGVVRRRATFGLVFVLVFGAIVGYTLLTPPTYTTDVKLIAGAGSAPTAGQEQTQLPLLNALLAATTGVQTSETYAELFQETPVADRVINNLQLKMGPTEFLGHVKVRPVPNTDMLELDVSWSDPVSSAKVGNAFAAAFVDEQRQLVANQAQIAIDTLDKELPHAQSDAARAQTALTTFEARNDLADIQTQTQNTINAAAAVEAKINATELDRQQAQAQLSSIQSQLGHIGPTTGGQTNVEPNPVLNQLQTQLAQVNVQLGQAEQQYTDQYPAVIALKAQQADLQRQIAKTPPTIVASTATMPNPLYQQLNQQSATAQAQVAADAASLAQLRIQHANFAPQINSLPAKAARLFELQREAKLTQDVLTAIQQKINDANISKTTALSDVTITQPADPTLASKKPSLFLNTIVGFVVSFALALIVTLAIHAFDRRIRDERQIEEELELPVLASVPRLATLRNRLPGPGSALANPARNPVLSNGDTAPPARKNEPWLQAFAVESFLQLVTSLRYSADRDRPLRWITITSPAQGDGKSTIALNTAITMAHIEPRVLLIDGDLRRPTLHSRFNRALGRGLSDVLVGRSPLEEAILTTEYEGLDLMTSGTRTPNPVKLIQSRRFDEVMAELLKTYRTIIVDAPALAPVIDAAILAAKSDGTVLVVSMDATDANAVRKCVQKLAGVGANNILGTVANGIRPSKRATYDDYFYVEPEPLDRPAALP